MEEVDAAYQKLQAELLQLQKEAKEQPRKEMEAKMTIPPSQSYIESEKQYIHEVSMSKSEMSQEITSQKISLFVIIFSLALIGGVVWWLSQLLDK